MCVFACQPPIARFRSAQSATEFLKAALVKTSAQGTCVSP